MPTKVVAQDAVLGGDQLSGEKLTAENIMKEKPVILDVRPAFEFNLSHVPGAINIQWGDFSSSNSRYRGLLQTDLFALARRLSLIGIDPDVKVVVLGKGSQGSGEEGRVAWTLKILGIHDVYTLLNTSYRALNVTKENLPPENKPYWKPQVHESLRTSVKEFKNKVEKTDQDTVVLDVRSPQEFNLHNLSQIKSVKVSVINIEWKAFFNEKGFPSQKVESLLANHKITNKTNLLIISDHGVRSGAVTYALNFLGYKKASNFAGGYEQLN
ncbi:MAG: sulfurtransferase [Pseudobdellovibrionaceae bacterium]